MNVFSPSHCSLGWKKCSSYPTIKEQQSAICKCFQQQNTLFFSIPFVFGMKLLSFHPTTSSITHTRTTTHQFFSPYNTFFSVPFLVWDERNYFSHPQYTQKKKSHKKLLIYKNNVFFIQFQFWMKLIPTQRRRTRIMLDLSYSLFFSHCFIF